MKLQGRVALITGSGRGIGQATAKEFAHEGATVIVNDIDRDVAEETVRAITSRGAQARVAIADVTDEKQVEQMVQSVLDEFHRIDVLVNNVGGGPRGRSGYFCESSIENIRRSIEMNLFSALICSRAVINQMIAQGYGKIVNISSIVAVLGQTKGASYSIAKAGIEAFTASLAKEVAQLGINVNCVRVGLAGTDEMLARMQQKPERHKLLCDWSHFGRLGRPEEHAKAILFLASDDSSFMSGAVVPVDGGILMPRPM
ncbi:MAG: SDR family oxidoreductase [Chloroflexi bacterium]|nr:SDR family oxidoreductase [Chloroflexota bacterium]